MSLITAWLSTLYEQQVCSHKNKQDIHFQAQSLFLVASVTHTDRLVKVAGYGAAGSHSPTKELTPRLLTSPADLPAACQIFPARRKARGAKGRDERMEKPPSRAGGGREGDRSTGGQRVGS